LQEEALDAAGRETAPFDTLFNTVIVPALDAKKSRGTRQESANVATSFISYKLNLTSADLPPLEMYVFKRRGDKYLVVLEGLHHNDYEKAYVVLSGPQKKLELKDFLLPSQKVREELSVFYETAANHIKNLKNLGENAPLHKNNISDVASELTRQDLQNLKPYFFDIVPELSRPSDKKGPYNPTSGTASTYSQLTC